MSFSSSSSPVHSLLIHEQQLIQYIYPFWLIFGISGCILNLIVFSRPQLRATSCCIYFLAASADHLLTLIVGIAPSIYTLTHPDPQIESIVFCKIRGYLFQITLMVSRWFIAFACIDRYLSCSDNVNLRRFASARIAYRVIVTIIIVWILLCSHRVIFYEIKENLCGILTNPGAAIYHSLYVIIGGGLLPTTIMTICALLIRRNLALTHNKRVHPSGVKQQRKSLNQQVLLLLFIQIICYVIFTTPQLFNLIFSAISNTIPSRSTDRLAIERFIGFMAELILYLFPVTSFYLYTLTSRLFRQEFVTILRRIPLFRVMYLGNRIAPTGLNVTVDNRLENQLPTLNFIKQETIRSFQGR